MFVFNQVSETRSLFERQSGCATAWLPSRPPPPLLSSGSLSSVDSQDHQIMLSLQTELRDLVVGPHWSARA